VRVEHDGQVGLPDARVVPEHVQDVEAGVDVLAALGAQHVLDRPRVGVPAVEGGEVHGLQPHGQAERRDDLLELPDLLV